MSIFDTLAHRFGYNLSRISAERYRLFFDSAGFENVHNRCRKYTMTSDEKMRSLYDSVNYISACDIHGDFVECGVWRGGSSMVLACTLMEIGEHNRTIYLYDTFSGMSEPSSDDLKISDSPRPISGIEYWNRTRRGDHTEWCYSPLDDVKKNVFSTGYPHDLIRFTKGKVEDTIPRVIPDKIALLRLDTDFYESTIHEMEYLFPRLSNGGVLILDDYDTWGGAKKAVDEYLIENNVNILLNRMNGGGRIGVKNV